MQCTSTRLGIALGGRGAIKRERSALQSPDPKSTIMRHFFALALIVALFGGFADAKPFDAVRKPVGVTGGSCGSMVGGSSLAHSCPPETGEFGSTVDPDMAGGWRLSEDAE